MRRTIDTVIICNNNILFIASNWSTKLPIGYKHVPGRTHRLTSPECPRHDAAPQPSPAEPR